MIESNVNIKLESFEVPPEALLKMCEDFKKEVFKRAGKSDFLLSQVAEG